MITTRRTQVRKIDGEYVELVAYPEQGAWYEYRQIEPGMWVHPGSVGSLYAPMRADGEPDWDNLGEILVEYDQA
jgi:hypothetical protein